MSDVETTTAHPVADVARSSTDGAGAISSSDPPQVAQIIQIACIIKHTNFPKPCPPDTDGLFVQLSAAEQELQEKRQIAIQIILRSMSCSCHV